MNVKRVSLLTISWFIGLTAFVYGDWRGPLTGGITNTDSGPQYHLDFNFGIERWENGKRSEKSYELWNLNCSSHNIVSKKPTSWCSLDQNFFWLHREDAVITFSHNFDSSEGTLRLIHTDWENGVLDLDIVHGDKSVTTVKIRMVLKDEIIYLRSFSAFAIRRGLSPDSPITPLEFRIPDYTYIVNVPVKMRGFRSEKEKKWDDILSSLSQQDQEAWENYQAEGLNKCDLRNTSTIDQFREKIPDFKKRQVEIQKGGEMTTDEKSLLKEYALGPMSECLARSNISLEGQKTILEAHWARVFGDE